MSTSAAEGVVELLGSELVLRDPAEREGWTVGGRSPDAVVLPRCLDELAQVLGTASERGWPVLPAGAGGWLGGGGPPADVGLVVSTRRMAEVTEYEPGDLTLTAGAGLSLDALDRRAGEHGQWLPQDPPAWPRSTLGAFVATGLPGPLVAGFGRPRDHILGLTAVTGDGRVVRPGGRVVKNVAGFDLVRLLAGSWGTLGVIAGATVRLFPRPEADVTLLFQGKGALDLVAPARALATASVVPEAVELLAPPPGREGTRRDRGGPGERGSPGTGTSGESGRTGGAVLAVRLLGSRDAVAEKERIVRDAAAVEPERRLEGSGSERLHRGMATGAPDGGLALRLALLPDRLERLVEIGGEVAGRARARGFRSRLAVHVTRGVLRLEARREGAPGADDDWVDYLDEVRRELRSEGGGLSVVHGPEPVVRALSERGEHAGNSPEGILRGLKAEFDPAGVLAPGRLVAGTADR